MLDKSFGQQTLLNFQNTNIFILLNTFLTEILFYLFAPTQQVEIFLCTYYQQLTQEYSMNPCCYCCYYYCYPYCTRMPLSCYYCFRRYYYCCCQPYRHCCGSNGDCQHVAVVPDTNVNDGGVERKASVLDDCGPTDRCVKKDDGLSPCDWN